MKNVSQASTSVAAPPKPIYDCKDILSAKPYSASGIYPLIVNGQNVQVYCDMTTNGGGWTVFQRRKDGSENFNRSWADCAAGFGKLDGEFWLGNDNLAAILGKKTPQILRIELEHPNGSKLYAEYNNFQVLGATNNYKLASLGAFSGDAGDAFSYHIGSYFTTFDKDLDSYPQNCAVVNHGPWWFYDCHRCNLNGEYGNNNHVQGINWYQWTGWDLSLKSAAMKFRSTN